MSNATTIVASGNLNQKPAEQVPEVLSAEAGLGMDDGKAIREEMEKADVSVGQLTRNLLIERAKQFNGNSGKIKEYLYGFRKAFPDHADVRASEAKALLDAYGKDPEKVLALTCGYHPLIAACREIRGKTNRGRQAGGAKKLSDKGMASIELAVPLMTAKQAKGLINKAITQLVQAVPEHWEKAILVQIEDLAMTLANSKQEIFQKTAEKIVDVCGGALDHIALAEAETQAEKVAAEALVMARTTKEHEAQPAQSTTPQPATVSDEMSESDVFKALQDGAAEEQQQQQEQQEQQESEQQEKAA